MVSVKGNDSDNLILKMRQLRDSWENTIHGDDRFSLLGFYKCLVTGCMILNLVGHKILV